MAGPVLIAALALAAQSGFEAVLELHAEGRSSEALALAERLSDPLASIQAELWVRHHAGDLPGALRAGTDGLATHPDDPWLLERAAALALDLGAPERARSLAERLERAAADPTLAEADRARYSKAAGAHGAAADRALALLARRDRALARARWTVALGAAAALAFWLRLCDPRAARKGPSIGLRPAERPRAR